MEQAVKVLHEGKFTIVVEKNEQQFTSTKRGIAPILELLKENPSFLQEANIADKVIGKAAALLLIYGKVKHIHADVISEHAAQVLNLHQVSYSYDQIVPYIINRVKTDMCPMEKCVLTIDDPNEALEALKLEVARMQGNK